ncbi:EAL domain-containing protein [Pseudomonas moorei]|nr:EAL domain-containing protein [Pseudomonas moorei]
MLHEAGSLVVVEGMETEHEALVAIAANADMV